MKRSGPPKAYQAFIKKYPELGEAWECIRRGEAKGPLDRKTARLVKLGVAVGSFREGAVHSAVRKAVSAGASRAEIEHAVTLAASIMGLPATVAIDSWVRETLE